MLTAVTILTAILGEGWVVNIRCHVDTGGNTAVFNLRYEAGSFDEAIEIAQQPHCEALQEKLK